MTKEETLYQEFNELVRDFAIKNGFKEIGKKLFFDDELLLFVRFSKKDY
jgi:hypothetical protein